MRTISFYAEAKDKEFLLIGGHAINIYGLSRQTGNIDLVVRRDDRNWWLELFSRLKYQVGQNDDKFARFRSDILGVWPLNLMFVDNNTFEKLLSQATAAQIGLAQVKAVSARHLATMKIHALKIYQAHRHVKDYNDLLWLLRSGKTQLSLSEVEELCNRYASSELFEKIKQDWNNK
ncbi:MAG: nucleotidyl transferase AbiEii/AbiGii toxin family protein [Deltaproteobacteria bacterium]|nr:nucleotidyl transferase AbiEii/AbiGii toxin family protein [Deltaproteobacteria bacterium]